VHHLGDQSGRKATELAVEREVTLEGMIRDLDTSSGKLTIQPIEPDGAELDGAELMDLPVASNCVVTLNKQSESAAGQLFKVADLQTNDKVTCVHDTRIVRIDAYRVFRQTGTIERVYYDTQELDVDLDAGLDDGTSSVRYLVGPQCKLTFGDDPIELGDLRDGDIVVITHDSLDADDRPALTVDAQRPADESRWAILIANQNYADRTLPTLRHPVADARLLENALTTRYRVPPKQIGLLIDETMEDLAQAIADRLRNIGSDGKVILYIAGHAYVSGGKVYLAPKDFAPKHIATTGLSLQTVVDQLEACEAKEKLLLFDCCQPGTNPLQPSTSEMIDSLKTSPNRSPFRTLSAVASCGPGQRATVSSVTGQGLFANTLAKGYMGSADGNRNTRIDPTELVEYLKQNMAAPGNGFVGKQTPQLYPPETRPPRLSAEAKAAIRVLGAAARTINSATQLPALEVQYLAAKTLSAEEPEPDLLYGLILVKARNFDDARKTLEAARVASADSLISMQAIAWSLFEKEKYSEGIVELKRLVDAMSKKPEPIAESSEAVFKWVGQLREFAESAARLARRPTQEELDALDAAVAKHGPQIVALYNAGRSDSTKILNDFDQQFENTTNAVAKSQLPIDRRTLKFYATFPFDDFIQQILDRLDQ